MNSEEKKEINNDSSDEILTIPNILSFFRILLITPFMILFLNGQYVWAAVMIIISGLTDCLLLVTLIKCLISAKFLIL